MVGDGAFSVVAVCKLQDAGTYRTRTRCLARPGTLEFGIFYYSERCFIKLILFSKDTQMYR